MSKAQLQKSYSVKALFIAGFCLVAIIKVYLATILDLYSDEIFYWQASTEPALAYSDLPFMTALLAGIGSILNPASALAVRSIFIVMGTAIPFLLYWVARPIVKHTQALEAAALSLCIPLAGFLGLLAVPDVPLIFFGLLSIGFFERALRTDKLPYWAGLGLMVAGGFSTHYRFFPYLMGALLFLIFSEAGRACWRKPGLWLAIAIGSLGLYPILAFNLNNDLSGLGYHLMDRHPWEFQAGGFLHIFKQAGLVTPPLYGILLFTLWQTIKLARKGDKQAAILLSISLPNLLIFLILAPWTDNTRTSIHWPLSGYFPLLVFAPASIRLIHQSLAVKLGDPIARKCIAAIPILGFTGTLVALIGVGSQAFHGQLQPLLGNTTLSNKMTGWKDFSQYTKTILEREFSENVRIVISDNYYTEAQLEFALGQSVSGFTIDKDKAVRDGRIAQYALWQKDQSALNSLTGKNALFVTEDSTLTIPDKYRVMETICSAANNVELLDQLSLLNGEKRFSFYRISGIDANATSNPCPYPSQGWLDQPAEGNVISGITQVSGWIFNEDIGVNKTYLLIGGQQVAQINYGNPRPDVVNVMNVKTDPNSPNLGFNYSLDTTLLSNGQTTLAIEIWNNVGEVQVYGERSLRIQNP